MFNPRTLFILGAGASQEFGLPVGTQLAAIIADRLNVTFDRVEQISGDSEIVDALKIHVRGDLGPHLRCAAAVSSGIKLTHSIDAYLDIHKDNGPLILCGKLAVAQSIITAERESLLYSDPLVPPVSGPTKFDRIYDSWLMKFFRILNSGVAKEDAKTLFRNIAIINFNYDRCVEHFLSQAIADIYTLPIGEAETIARTLKIHRPYGSTGPLPWQDTQHAVPFGGHTGRPDALLEMGKQIRTYTEQVEEQSEVDAIKAEVAKAEVIIFLGFAFHGANMQLLSIADTPFQRGVPIRVYATAKGMSQADRAVVEAQIARALSPSYGPSLYVHDIPCTALFDEYGRSFSLA